MAQSAGRSLAQAGTAPVLSSAAGQVSMRPLFSY